MFQITQVLLERIMKSFKQRQVIEWGAEIGICFSCNGCTGSCASTCSGSGN